jgi:hypothetical protein
VATTSQVLERRPPLKLDNELRMVLPVSMGARNITSWTIPAYACVLAGAGHHCSTPISAAAATWQPSWPVLCGGVFFVYYSSKVPSRVLLC